MKYTKHQVEQYCIRPEKDDTFYWADISIDVTGEKSGTLMIRSDYGSWDHHWSHCGTGFREFLLTLNDDYLMRKLELGRTKEFREVETLRAIKGNIEQSFADGDVDEQQYKLALKEADQVYLQSSSNASSYWSYIEESCPVLYQHVFYKDPTNVPWVETYSRSVERFVAEVWPVFKSIIQEESK